MTKRYQVTLIDDVDGNLADETVTFGLDGVSYEIELTTKHATELREFLAPWIAQARVRGTRPSGRRGRHTPGSAMAIREWAAENGIECPHMGRIPRAVRDQYVEAVKN